MEYPLSMKTFLLAVLLGWPLLAVAQNDSRKPEKKVDPAVERCKAQRGVDCDTPEGLNEWRLQERSRSEAVKDGSRHRLPPSPGPR
jgi:hypothetical protein